MALGSQRLKGQIAAPTPACLGDTVGVREKDVAGFQPARGSAGWFGEEIGHAQRQTVLGRHNRCGVAADDEERLVAPVQDLYRARVRGEFQQDRRGEELVHQPLGVIGTVLGLCVADGLRRRVVTVQLEGYVDAICHLGECRVKQRRLLEGGDHRGHRLGRIDAFPLDVPDDCTNAERRRADTVKIPADQRLVISSPIEAGHP